MYVLTPYTHLWFSRRYSSDPPKNGLIALRSATNRGCAVKYEEPHFRNDTLHTPVVLEAIFERLDGHIFGLYISQQLLYASVHAHLYMEVCCSVLQGVAVCCSVLQCVAMYCSAEYVGACAHVYGIHTYICVCVCVCVSDGINACAPIYEMYIYIYIYVCVCFCMCEWNK